MKMLINQTKLKDLKFNDLIPFECEICNKIFHKEKRRYHTGVIVKNRKHAMCYCSEVCRDKANIKIQKYKCNQCNVSILRLPSKVKNHVFCSSSCFAKFINKNRVRKKKIKIVKIKPEIIEYQLLCEMCHLEFKRKSINKKNKSGKIFCGKSCRMKWYNINQPCVPKGYRRSLFESKLEEKLKQLYPNIDFLFNDRKTINYELDIYVPSINLAIELNGIHHYKAIRGGPLSLMKVQERDKLKIELCKERNIELIVIDISGYKKSDEKTINLLSVEIGQKINKLVSGLGSNQILI